MRLARAIRESSHENLPAPVRHEAKRALVNWMGASLGGCTDESVRRAKAAFSRFAARGQATLIGHADRYDALTAAVVNGISANILDFDDTHAHIVLHPTASIACALLALGEARPLRGPAFLHALVLGVEVEARLLDPRVADYPFPWSPTTTVAGIGSAAACARAMELDETRIAWAIGIASTQASGLRDTGGSMSKAFNAGQAARAGLTAALLAAEGYTGSTTALEGPNGFVNAFGTPRDMECLLDGWGETHQLMANTYKAFPCGIVTHPAICACLDLHAQGIDAGGVSRFVLRVHPVAVKLTGRRHVTGPLDAKLSVAHAAAAALVRGKVGIREFDPACIEHPAVARLRQAAELVVEEKFAIDEAAVELVLADGRRISAHTEHAVGSLVRPMTDAQLADKLAALAEGVLPPPRIAALVDLLWSMDDLDDTAELARAAAGTL